MGWCRAREERCRQRGAHLGKWWLLGRWSPAAGTGGELAFLSAGSPLAAGDWKPQVGSLPLVCAISLFGCWTTPDGERRDYVWLTRSCCLTWVADGNLSWITALPKNRFRSLPDTAFVSIRVCSSVSFLPNDNTTTVLPPGWRYMHLKLIRILLRAWEGAISSRVTWRGII